MNHPNEPPILQNAQIRLERDDSGVAPELLDIELNKVTRHTDWSSPNLSPEQVRYAISDVTFLLPLKDRLDDMLAREGRRELAESASR